MATTTHVDDLFDSASEVLLAAHSPDIGGTWTPRVGGNDFRVGASTGYAWAYAGYAAVSNSAALASTDWDITGYFDRVSSGAFPGFRVFAQMTTGGVGYMLVMGHYGEWIRLFKTTDWSTGGTHVAETALTTPSGTTTIQLQKRGAAIKCFVNGTERMSHTDGSPLTAGTLTGFGFDGSGSSDGRILRFTATSESGGGGGGSKLPLKLQLLTGA